MARVTVEETIYASIPLLQMHTGLDYPSIVGHLVLLWRFSQESGRVSGSTEEICEWAWVVKGQEAFIKGLLKAKFIRELPCISEGDATSILIPDGRAQTPIYLICGNEKHVSNLRRFRDRARKAAEARWSKSLEIDKKSLTKSEVYASSMLDDACLSYNTIQYNTNQYSTNQDNTKQDKTSKTKKKESASARKKNELHPLAMIWNQHADASLDRVERLQPSGKRYRACVARWSENPNPEFWISVIQKINQSPGCLGKNDRNWTANFEFLCKPDTAEKVLEGKYKNWGVNFSNGNGHTPVTKQQRIQAQNDELFQRKLAEVLKEEQGQ